jgi:DNA-binding NtrC family response regulator
MGSQQMKVLVVDDEAAMREVLKVRLEELGFDVRLAGDAAEASSKAKVFQPDLVISDVVMPDRSGLDLLRDLRAGDSERCVILMTAHGTVDMAVEAMKEGAKDFFTKPLDYSRFKTLLDDIQRELKARREPEKAAADPQRDLGQRGVFVGDSDRMRSVFQMIEEVAGTEVPALLTGESGTGKELAARRIHHLSRRRHRPFIAINAAAIPSGLMESELFGHEAGAFTGAIGIRQGCFELANGGTLFLDEIAEMPPALQPKLLRVLEDGRVRRVGGSKEYQLDVRVLAATNQEPMTAIKNGRLRKDLYYRLNVFTIHLPPLRERPEDLPSLTGHFVDEFNLKYQTHIRGLAKGAVTLLEKYRWPGNVRELRNVLERAAVLARRGCIEPSHLPRQLQEPGSNPSDAILLPAGTSVADAERELILQTLEQTGKNKAEAARRLGIDVKTIRNKLKSYGTGRR